MSLTPANFMLLPSYLKVKVFDQLKLKDLTNIMIAVPELIEMVGDMVLEKVVIINAEPRNSFDHEAIANSVEDRVSFTIKNGRSLYQLRKRIKEIKLMSESDSPSMLRNFKIFAENREYSHFMNSTQLLEITNCEQGITNDFCLPNTLFNLKSLHLQHNRLRVFPTFHVLRQLEYLDLSYNNLQSVGGVSRLTHLKELNLSHNKLLKNFNGLANLVSLREINASDCGLKNVSWIKQLKRLKSVDFSDNNIGDFEVPLYETPISETIDTGVSHNISSLRYININGNKNARLKNFSCLTNLKVLEACGCSGIKIRWLPKLRKLSIEGNDGSHIDHPERLQELEIYGEIPMRLDIFRGLHSLKLIGSSSLIDINILIGITTLKKLHIERCSELRSIEALSSLVSLQHLTVKAIPLKKMVDCSRMTELTKLEIIDCGVSDIEGLESITKLKELNLSRNLITKIQGLDSLVNLVSLNFSWNRIDQIENLSGIMQLEKLDISRNENISKVDHIVNHVKLRHLNLSYTNIAELDKLAGFQCLNKLELKGTQLTKFPKLSSFPNLNTISFPGNSSFVDTMTFKTLSRLLDYHIVDFGKQRWPYDLANLKSDQVDLNHFKAWFKTRKSI